MLFYPESRSREASWFPDKALAASAPLLHSHLTLAPPCFQILDLLQILDEDTGAWFVPVVSHDWSSWTSSPAKPSPVGIVDSAGEGHKAVKATRQAGVRDLDEVTDMGLAAGK